jgi:large subunit ribosomal protein L25
MIKSNTITLEASLKDDELTINALREKGFIPAVVYGHGIDTINLMVPEKEFDKFYKKVGANTMIELEWKSGAKKEKRPVLIHEVQHDYLKGKTMHVDFYQVRLDEKIKTHIPLVFINEAPAVKNLSGILVKSLQEIEVEALPQELPQTFEVDLSKLETFESNIKVKDLSIPSSAKVFISSETVIASVTPPRSEEELEANKQAVVEKLEEVKVETEEKKAEREAEKAATKDKENV